MKDEPVADPGHLVGGGDFLGGWISRVIFYDMNYDAYFYRHPSEAKVSDYCFLLFIFLFTVHAQKLLDRFLLNFQELCILV